MNNMVRGYLRGHEIEWVYNEWLYSDTKQPTADTYKERPCGKCGEFETEEYHDHCLGTLPGVIAACCGHGRNREAYVILSDGKDVRGDYAIELIKKLKDE